MWSVGHLGTDFSDKTYINLYARTRRVHFNSIQLKNVYCPTNTMAQVKTHTYRHVHTHMYTYRNVCIYIHIHAYKQIHTWIYTPAYTFAPTTMNWIMLKHIDSNNIYDCRSVRLWWLVHVGLSCITLKITKGNKLHSISEWHHELSRNYWPASV